MRFKCARRPASLPSSASAVNGFLGASPATTIPEYISEETREYSSAHELRNEVVEELILN